jgi:hypothetical protein
MTLGTNNKKQVVALSVLGVVAAYLVYSNLLAGPDVPRQTRRAGAPASQQLPVAGAPASGEGVPKSKRAMSRIQSEEFHPVYLDKNPTRRRDTKTIDPTLQLARFTNVQNVELAGGARNVFQFAPAPPPPTAPAPPKPVVPDVVVYVAQGPRQPPPPPAPPPPPPPPPITLKFYGFATTQDDGRKTAYLMDGEDIYIAAEGDTLKKRYKIVRILPTSILIEDLEFKRQQSVPLTEETPANAG